MRYNVKGIVARKNLDGSVGAWRAERNLIVDETESKETAINRFCSYFITGTNMVLVEATAEELKPLSVTQEVPGESSEDRGAVAEAAVSVETE